METKRLAGWCYWGERRLRRLYRRVRFLYRRVRFLRRVGLRHGVPVLLALRSKRPSSGVRVPGVRTPVYIRTKTIDPITFETIFIQEQYDLKLPELRPKLIIDGGANVGYATLYFALRYPEAKIVAVEPEEGNYDLLVRNTSSCPNVIPVRAALWHTQTVLEIADSEAETNAYQVREPGRSSRRAVRAVTVPELVDLADAEHVDLLKLDIEGAEKELFAEGYEGWLGRVGVIVIELHDWLRPGSGQPFRRAASRYGFKRRQHGPLRRSENEIWIRQCTPAAKETLL